MIPQKHHHDLNKSSQAGFTLIESLVAIVVLSVLLISVSPIIAFSVGTRVQSRRLELGSLAARAYVDALRAAGGCQKSQDTSCPLDPPKLASAARNQAPSGVNLPCDSGKYCDTQKTVYCVDGDNQGENGDPDTRQCTDDSLSDMLVQADAFNASSDPDQGYSLILRVYRADAFKSGAAPLKVTGQQSTVTNAVGNPSIPVAKISTEVPPKGTTFKSYCERLNKDGVCQ